jgi:ATP-dependent Clp protease, protease subunit
MTNDPPEILPPGEPRRPIHYPPVPIVPMPPGHQDPLRQRIYEDLLARRTVFLDRPLDLDAATLVAAQLMTLDAEGDADEAITIVVNSQGGPLDAVGGVLDTIDLVRAPVHTSCLGQAAGTSAVVVAAGTGRRRAGAGAMFHLRLPDIELAGTAGRLRDEVDHQRQLHEAMIDRLAAITGQDRKLVARDIDQGRTLTADEALAYGLIDEIARKGG